MKKAFTMIELIFVIVILGILAAVVIPRLAVARDDAKISKFSQNLSMTITDCISFYISQGKYDKDISKMTNVDVVNKKDYTAELAMNDVSCVKIVLYNENDTKNGINKGSLEVIPINKDNVICKKLHLIPSIKNHLQAKRYIINNTIN
ncbi:putative type II secretion system protein [Campylobacter blaseri]|uniref:Prepilin-type cleavage/methylation domain-containing protein n=1 Tax=Campylobacter blaseri TaxID=2042961 RepID=A0A2P8R007_9BACT|nr:type II secretion system protein [Campylobacter blaseri]PSM51820.1 prepilin-type cleavage/methylation domain-containing protein [Campylobacter blaseri]PSM53611.1 prepilin-type cleavage/methylation domain-containing protein [Campylobacter blaseri]QKF86423.1 putative type II secretion system protein [Campylobacter blaseri]